MKKIMTWAMAAALICGASVLTSCSSNDDNPVTPDLNVSDKIIGKWMPVDIDGLPVLTDKKSVYTFVSATKAYMSVSTNSQQGVTWTAAEARTVLAAANDTYNYNYFLHWGQK